MGTEEEREEQEVVIYLDSWNETPVLTGFHSSPLVFTWSKKLKQQFRPGFCAVCRCSWTRTSKSNKKKALLFTTLALSPEKSSLLQPLKQPFNIHHPRISHLSSLFPMHIQFYNGLFHELCWLDWSWLSISETIYTFLPNTVPWKPSKALVQGLGCCLLR